MEVECLALRDLISPMKNKVDEARGESEQKENICVERRRTTPLKNEPAATMPYGKKANPTPDLVHITPIKHPDPSHPHPEPWTPTANLKMLISAASPDIRDREMKKVLFRPIENEREMEAEPQEETEVEDPCQFDPVEEEAEEDGERKPSRKQKSLGLLCQKFLALYPDYPASSEDINISLDEVATSLGVERRRIYDIVNVLESLMIVARMAKNWYVWHGRQRLASTLAELHELGRRQRYHLHMDQARESSLREETATPAPEDGADAESGYAAASKRKDKSLRIMSQKFVMLFLVSKTQTVTLDVAAKILIEESQDTASHSKYKTKVRRLYDIANVLTSLGLIKKIHVREERGRKPAFKWIGPTDFQTRDEDSQAVAGISLPVTHADRQLLAAHDARKQKLARHASFNVVPTSAANQRRINSAPSSPRRDLTGQLPQPMDYSRRSASNSAVYRLQFGNTTDTQTTTGQRSPNHSAGPLLRSPRPAPLATPVHPEGPYGSLRPPASFSPLHHLAYLPSLSQPSVVMLYGGPAPQDGPDGTLQGQSSPEPGSRRRESVLGKRKSDDDDDEGRLTKRDKWESAEVEESRKRRVEGQSEEGAGRWSDSPGTSPRDDPTRLPGDGEAAKRSPSDLAQPSHYLYVPNSAGLNSLNFLLSAGQTPGSLALPPGSVPTLAYLLVPSNLPHYPLMANGLQATGTETRANPSFNMPTVVSPGHFMVGAGHYAVAGLPEFSGSVPTPASPEQPRVYGSALVPLHSPLEPRQHISIPQTEPLTPLTPKEIAAGGSKAFFQTPGTLGSVDTAPAVRRRGSAQRRLDIGHPPAN